LEIYHNKNSNKIINRGIKDSGEPSPSLETYLLQNNSKHIQKDSDLAAFKRESYLIH
jgi:hypothetical protein